MYIVIIQETVNYFTTSPILSSSTNKHSILFVWQVRERVRSAGEGEIYRVQTLVPFPVTGRIGTPPSKVATLWMTTIAYLSVLHNESIARMLKSLNIHNNITCPAAAGSCSHGWDSSWELLLRPAALAYSCLGRGS
jgi:hypothetical protein